jgi:hypothetical protein
MERVSGAKRMIWLKVAVVDRWCIVLGSTEGQLALVAAFWLLKIANLTSSDVGNVKGRARNK